MKRRTAITKIPMLGASIGLVSCTVKQSEKAMKPTKLLGNINHSACRWCYQDIPLEEFADHAVDLGLSSIELLDPEEWSIVTDRGLTCGISNGSKLGITKGFNDLKNHGQLLTDYQKLIPLAADQGIKQIICFSGNRNGISDEQGIDNCAIGLDPVVKLAEKHNIQITMELLNSKVDHADYQCDHTPWGAALVDKIGSSNFKLLYDIYHMQIMEGDVIRTIKKNAQYISHYHTGGVPGRNEINESQELYYPAIMKAIAELEDFNGYVAQEFIPTRKDPFISLAEGVTICDI